MSGRKPYKLTAKKVLQIIKYLKQGKTQISLSAKYKVAVSHINNIKQGYNWSHVTKIRSPKKIAKATQAEYDRLFK